MFSWLTTAMQLAIVATLILASRFLKYGGMIIFVIVTFFIFLTAGSFLAGTYKPEKLDQIIRMIPGMLTLWGASFLTSWFGELLILLNERLATHLNKKMGATEEI